MKFEKETIERIMLESEEEMLSLSEEQANRLKELDNKLSQYVAMLHTFKKNYYETPFYKGSHSDFKQNDKI